MTHLKSLADYGLPFQIKVISSLLNNKEFLVNINDSLNVEHFSNPAHQWVISEIVSYCFEGYFP